MAFMHIFNDIFNRILMRVRQVVLDWSALQNLTAVFQLFDALEPPDLNRTETRSTSSQNLNNFFCYIFSRSLCVLFLI